MPTPDVPHPSLAASLPLLRARLEEQREFRIEQLVELAAAELAVEEQATAAGASPLEAAARARTEMSALLASGARQALADIERALRRMATGRYGMCLHCGAPIELARLHAVPQTALCASCQRGAERA